MKKILIISTTILTVISIVAYFFSSKNSVTNDISNREEPLKAINNIPINEVSQKTIEDDRTTFNCFEYAFDSHQQQGDSINFFMTNALDSTLNEPEKWEKKFFCAFPNSYEEMDSLFGFNSEESPLYYSSLQYNHSMFEDKNSYISFFGSRNSYINFFGNLKTIPDRQYYEKFINICVDGHWQADNIRTAFGFGKRLLRHPSPACHALNKRSDKDIKSVFRFIFDSIHPKHDMNEKFYNYLLPIIEKENQKLALLLIESYDQLMSENHEH